MSGPARVRVDLERRSYDVLVGAGAAARLARTVAAAGGRRVFVLADGRVADLHGEELGNVLSGEGLRSTLHVLPEGERAKTIAVVEASCRALVNDGAERADWILGLGGGAATDVAGFVAAIALRGLHWVAVPTSLLGMVDAAIGGKTGVNLPEGKNLVGAFHQPRAVACDPAFLQTLPPREFRCGLAEAVKTAWIGDAALFEAMEGDPPVVASHPSVPEIVRRCVAVKADIVARDEREGGLRAVLNFGHTIGHALETEGRGTWLHGEAVALGMVAAVRLSVDAGRCDGSLLERLEALLTTLGLPIRDPSLDPSAVIARAGFDKKRAGGVPAYVLTAGLGLVSVASDLPEEAPWAAVEFLRR